MRGAIAVAKSHHYLQGRADPLTLGSALGGAPMLLLWQRHPLAG